MTGEWPPDGGSGNTGIGSFEDVWRLVRGQAVFLCRAQARNGLDGEELYQRVMIRAWRGHQGFRGDSAYLTWVRQIIVREAGRMAAAREAELRRRVAIDPVEAVEVATMTGAGLAAGSGSDDPAAAWLAGRGWGVAPGGLADLLDQAVRTGAVTAGEHGVLTARLRHPEHTWQQIGAMLGVTATACAVTHCRAVPKLRVFLFLHRREVLGGPAEIGAAFDRARPRLTAAEAEAFTALVLQGSTTYRRRGWPTTLRGACATVAEELLNA